MKNYEKGGTAETSNTQSGSIKKDQKYHKSPFLDICGTDDNAKNGKHIFDILHQF